MSISLSKGKIPLAVIRGSRKGKRDGKMFYLNEPVYANSNQKVDSDSDSDTDDDRAKIKSVPDVTLSDGNMSMIPSDPWRDTYYVFGPARSGKSVWVGNYLCEYNLKYPDNPIYIVSRKSSDDAFEGVELNYIDYTTFWDPKKKKATPMNTDDFPANSLVVFDDFDSIDPKPLFEAVNSMLTDLLNVGGNKHISVIVTNHLGSDYKRTRGILNEAHNIVVFPRASNPESIRYVLSKYAGIDKEAINKIINKVPSRWVAIRKVYPKAVIHSAGAYVLNGLDS
jgi:adenosyl cobinamide kinase/adenosyl cobinamide phosphate guanylyltransferase